LLDRETLDDDGLEPGQFRKLVRIVANRGGDEIADGRPGRQWRLDLADRVLLVATYWRTNLTMRQIGPVFGVSHSAAHRGKRHDRPTAGAGPCPHTADRRCRDRGRHLGADTGSPAGYAVEELPVLGKRADRDRRGHPAGGRHWRRVSGQPQRLHCLSRFRNRAGTGRVPGDGRWWLQGNYEVIMPYRKPRDGSDLPAWQEDLNAGHRKIRARVEHALARMKCWKILRDHRRAASTLNDTVSGIAHLHNILLTD
jgi:hypothetical protein